MATSSSSSTPRKTCILSDVCILCGFAFIQIEKTSFGEERIHKHFDKKLKLTVERLEIIRKITGLTDIDVTNVSSAGVCIKCYRTADSIMKTESKNDVIKQKFREVAQKIVKTNMLQLPSPSRKSITKRMLRSPDVPSSKKQSFDISYVNLVKIRPFMDLTNTCLPAELQKKEVIIILFMGFIIIFKLCTVHIS